MSSKEYNSPEYFAQGFATFLKRPQASFYAEHHGAKVHFSIFKDNYSLEFLAIDDSKSHVVLEKKVEDSYVPIKNVYVKVMRSRKGKISEVYFSNLLKRLFKDSANRE